MVAHSTSDKRRILSECDDVDQDLKRHKVSDSLSAEYSDNTQDLLDKMEKGQLTQPTGTLFKNMRMVPREQKMRRLEFEESIRRALDKICTESDEEDEEEEDESEDGDGVVVVLCREFEDIFSSVSGFFKSACNSPMNMDANKKTQ